MKKKMNKKGLEKCLNIMKKFYHLLNIKQNRFTITEVILNYSVKSKTKDIDRATQENIPFKLKVLYKSELLKRIKNLVEKMTKRNVCLYVVNNNRVYVVVDNDLFCVKYDAIGKAIRE